MAMFDKIPEQSYGLLETVIGTVLFSIAPLIFSFINVNSFILFFYYTIVIFMLIGFALHLRSHEITDETIGWFKKTLATRKEIEKYERKHKI